MKTVPFGSRSKQRGFSMFVTAVSAGVMFGMLGLSLDMGRMYIVKNELQAFTDSAALAAAFELDETMAGIERARTISQTGPGTGVAMNKWNFTTETIPAAQIGTAFSTISTGGWDQAPATAVGMSFVRVSAFADVPVYFLRVIGIGGQQRVSTLSFAGHAQGGIGVNAAPFSPDALTPANTENFGFIAQTVFPDGTMSPGPLLYTLKWVPNGLRCNMYPNRSGQTTVCPVAATIDQALTMGPQRGYCSGDYYGRYQPNLNGYALSNAEADRGYINVGQGSGTQALAEAIVNQNYNPSDVPDLSIGAQIDVVAGNRGTQIRNAMNQRVDQDTDTISTTYQQYLASQNGNGRRLLAVPINDPTTNEITGYATFFLPLVPCGTGNNDPCCAEFVGKGAIIGGTSAGPSTGSSQTVSRIRLFSGGY